jgi:hypothetical protein
MRLLVAAVGLLVVAAPLHGQMVMTNDTLDAERRDVRDVLVVLRDSLRTVEAAAAQFQRGNASASPELLYSRGKTIKSACIRSIRNVEPARQVVKADDWGNEHQTLWQNELLQAMDSLEQSLNACEATWDHLATPENADQIRTTGPPEAESISNDIKGYSAVVGGYFKALGIYVSPAGS